MTMTWQPVLRLKTWQPISVSAKKTWYDKNEDNVKSTKQYDTSLEYAFGDYLFREWEGEKGETYHIEASGTGTSWTCTRWDKNGYSKTFTVIPDEASGKIWWGHGWAFFCDVRAEEAHQTHVLSWYRPGSRTASFVWWAKPGGARTGGGRSEKTAGPRHAAEDSAAGRAQLSRSGSAGKLDPRPRWRPKVDGEGPGGGAGDAPPEKPSGEAAERPAERSEGRAAAPPEKPSEEAPRGPPGGSGTAASGGAIATAGARPQPASADCSQQRSIANLTKQLEEERDQAVRGMAASGVAIATAGAPPQPASADCSQQRSIANLTKQLEEERDQAAEVPKSLPATGPQQQSALQGSGAEQRAPPAAPAPPAEAGPDLHSGEPQWSVDAAGQPSGEPRPPRTTVQFRNLPYLLSRDVFVELLNSQGFQGQFDLVYLPMDFKTNQSLGYGFVNAVNHEAALRFFSFFEGFQAWPMKSSKVCSVCWSSQQGFEYNVKIYRNQTFMRDSVRDAWKPALYSQGVRVPFPASTRSKRFRKQHDSDDTAALMQTAATGNGGAEGRGAEEGRKTGTKKPAGCKPPPGLEVSAQPEFPPPGLEAPPGVQAGPVPGRAPPRAPGAAPQGPPKPPHDDDETRPGSTDSSHSDDPDGEVEAWWRPQPVQEFSVTVDKRSGVALGAKMEIEDGDSAVLRITCIMKRGLLPLWNATNPGRLVKPNDCIVGVNGQRGSTADLVEQLKQFQVQEIVIRREAPLSERPRLAAHEPAAAALARTGQAFLAACRLRGPLDGQWFDSCGAVGTIVGSTMYWAQQADDADGTTKVALLGSTVHMNFLGQMISGVLRRTSSSSDEIVWSHRDVWRRMD